MFYKKIYLIFIFILAGCAGSVSNLGEGSQAMMYPITVEQGENVILQALSENIPGKAITPVLYPSRGFTVGTKILFDSHTITATMQRAFAVDGDGNELEGISFTVQNAGTIPLSFGSKAKPLFDKINSLAMAISRPLAVVRTEPIR